MPEAQGPLLSGSFAFLVRFTFLSANVVPGGMSLDALMRTLRKGYVKETVGHHTVLLRERFHVGTDADMEQLREWLNSGEARVVGNAGGYTWCVSDHTHEYILVSVGVIE